MNKTQSPSYPAYAARHAEDQDIAKESPDYVKIETHYTSKWTGTMKSDVFFIIPCWPVIHQLTESEFQLLKLLINMTSD